jgi:hypothetical protein
MSGKIPARIAKLATAMLATGAVLAWATASAGATVTYTPIYSNLPSPLPGNVPSEAMEATSSSEFGGEVELAGPTLNNTKVTVAMSSWACQSGGAEDGSCVSTKGAKFEHPITLHIYTAGAGDSVGTQIASLTRTFKIPYRPTANPGCTGEGLGGWKSMGNCYHGKLFKATFVLKGVSIPSKAIVSVAFNTTDYGAEPTHVPGPYDSLNVGGFEGPPSVGSDPQPQSDYINSLWTGAYCDEGLAGTGSFRFDPALPSCVGPSDNFDNSGLQPGITVATG